MELVLVIALIGFIAAITVPVYLSFQNRQELDVAAIVVAQNVRRAQTLAMACHGDTAWGIYIQDSDVTVYRGTNYGSREIDLDEVTGLPQTVSVEGGVKDIVFTKFSGEPTAAAAITLNSNNSSKVISINEKGMVSY